MAAAMLVADYIIEKANKLGKPITNLKLQKMMFFLNVQYLLKYNKSLITDNKFEKWPYGPVVKQVYNQYSKFGADVIKKVPDFFYMVQKDKEYEIKTYSFHENDLDKSYRNFIDENIDMFIDKPVFKLVGESHKDPQWQNKSCPYYDDNELVKYYSQNKFW